MRFLSKNKSQYHSPQGLLQSLDIPNRNWEQVSMDFITQLPITKSKNDSIVVFVDRLSKMTHFVALKTTVTAPEFAQIFFDNVVKLHGIPNVIVSDRDSKFTSKFWKALWKKLGTKLALSTAFHPQTDGQTERANFTLEDMLRAYTAYKQNDWDEYLSAAEFACNDSKNNSTHMSPFFLNYGQHPLTPISSLYHRCPYSRRIWIKNGKFIKDC